MRLMPGVVLALTLSTTGPIRGDQSVPSAPPQAAATGTAAISGVVSDAATGRPIAGASVFLSATGPGVEGQLPRTWSSRLTDGRGRFVFVGLPSTLRYTVSASHSSYVLARHEGSSPAGGTEATTGGSVAIALAEGEWKKDADIRLTRRASIGGRVVDERGESVVGAAVQVFSRRMVAGHEWLVSGAVATTDDRGRYRVAYVQPGRYVAAVLSVQATVPASTPDGDRHLALGGLIGRGSSPPITGRTEAQGASIDVDGRHRLVLTNFATPPPPGADRPRAYAPVFFPNARTVAEAQAIDLDPGASRADVDFQLEPIATATVSGRVSGAVDGAVDMLLRLMAPGTEPLGFGAEVATTVVEADGTFTFLNVPAGAYTLLASPAVPEMTSGGGQSDGRLPRGVGYGKAFGLSAGYPAGPYVMWWRSDSGAAVWGRTTVSVGNAGVTGLDLPLRTSSSVRGRIVFVGPEQPDPGMRINITLEPANADRTLGVPNAWTAAGDETYAFAIEGLLDGRYLVRIAPYQRAWRVVSVTASGVDLTGTGFDGALGQDYNDVVVTVTKAGAELAGFVRDANGRPAAGGVILFPAAPRAWVDYGLTPDRVFSTSAGSDGAYRFTGVLDGDYNVVAVPPGQKDGWVDSRFLAAAAASAAKVSLRAGVSAAQDLRRTEVVVK